MALLNTVGAHGQQRPPPPVQHRAAKQGLALLVQGQNNGTLVLPASIVGAHGQKQPSLPAQRQAAKQGLARLVQEQNKGTLIPPPRILLLSGK